MFVHKGYTLSSLRSNVHPALDSVSLENIQNHFRKVRHYMFAYLEGANTGSVLESTEKQCKKSIVAHRRISEKHCRIPIILSSAHAQGGLSVLVGVYVCVCV